MAPKLIFRTALISVQVYGSINFLANGFIFEPSETKVINEGFSVKAIYHSWVIDSATDIYKSHDIFLLHIHAQLNRSIQRFNCYSWLSMTEDLVNITVSRTNKFFDNNAINTIGHWIMHLNKYLISWITSTTKSTKLVLNGYWWKHGNTFVIVLK